MNDQRNIRDRRKKTQVASLKENNNYATTIKNNMVK